jgi:hypothetical protein
LMKLLSMGSARASAAASRLIRQQGAPQDANPIMPCMLLSLHCGTMHAHAVRPSPSRVQQECVQAMDWGGGRGH